MPVIALHKHFINMKYCKLLNWESHSLSRARWRSRSLHISVLLHFFMSYLLPPFRALKALFAFSASAADYTYINSPCASLLAFLVGLTLFFRLFPLSTRLSLGCLPFPYLKRMHSPFISLPRCSLVGFLDRTSSCSGLEPPLQDTLLCFSRSTFRLIHLLMMQLVESGILNIIIFACFRFGKAISIGSLNI